MPPTLKVLLLALALAYFGLILFAVLQTPRALFPVPPASYAGEGPGAPPRLPVPGDEAVPYLWLPAEGATLAVLYFHGNGEDLFQVQPRLAAFQAQGYAVLACEYPGYGPTSGQPSEARLLAAAEAALAFLTGELGWRPQDVLAYGHSLGGGPAIDLGVRHRLRGVIVEATFTSVFRVVTEVRLLPWDYFNNLGKVARLQCPLLVIHGTADTTVPFRHGEKLFAKAPSGSQLWRVEGADHINIWDSLGDSLWPRLKRFAEASQHPS